MRYEDLMVYRWGTGVNERAFPVAAVDFLERAGLPPNLYNPYTEGGYLIHRLFPRMGVFQDNRSAAYPEEWLAALHARFTLKAFAENLERFRVNTALSTLREHSRLFLRSQWGMVFWDDRYVLLVRRTEANRELLDRWEYRHFRPDSPPQPVGDPQRSASILAEIRRNEAGRSFPDAWLLTEKGKALASLGRLAEAKDSLLRAVELAPESVAALVNLGLVRMEMPGEQAAGRTALEKALQLDPSQDWIRKWLAARGKVSP
jgi:tetratricopeptide (TPR) repeat protein